MTVTASIAGAISALAQFGMMFNRGRNQQGQNPFGPIGMLLMVILAPIAAAIVQMAISRSREYEADKMGAEICGQPMALAGALQKLEHYAHQRVNQRAEANPASAHMFIINPLSGARMDNLFSTHPRTANRVAALEKLAASMGALPGGSPWGQAIPHEKPEAQRGPWG
jgi:heat shock protein HtpX